LLKKTTVVFDWDQT